MKFKNPCNLFAPFFWRAFSLVELMITLIVISCIISALVPAITKKLHSQAITVGSGGGNVTMEFEQDCSAWGEDCALCMNNKCSLCSKECLESEYVETSSCSCKSCDIYNNCLECTSKQCKKCENGYYLNNTTCEICPVGSFCNGVDKTVCEDGKYSDLEAQTSCKTCESKTANCTKCNLTTGECISCKEGYLLSKGSCVKDCGDLAILINLNNKRFCMTKYNMGDNGLNYAIPKVNTVSINTTCDAYNEWCCWVGATASPTYSNSNDARYPGTQRTVCNWWAAREICAQSTYNGRTWQLPLHEDMLAISANQDLYLSNGENSLMFCSNNNNNITSTCNLAVDGRCPGAVDNDCIPHLIWGLEVPEDARAYSYNFNDSLLGIQTMLVAHAQSVRCVSYID